MATYKRNNEKTENPRVSGSIPLQATKESTAKAVLISYAKMKSNKCVNNT